ncbi:MAG TPA: STAS/SEC14 domain-containing protein [Rubricoccaceae bacterium]|nr:STAS/SEC14 domain-containing protein [Rubricoccaceae bacterium]
MIEVLNVGPDVLAYRINGRIERVDIERAFIEVDRRLAREGPLRAYVEVLSLDGISLDALGRDVWLGMQRLGLFPRLEKVALVSDSDWLQTLPSLPNPLMPRLEARAFPLQERAQAQAWVKA